MRLENIDIPLSEHMFFRYNYNLNTGILISNSFIFYVHISSLCATIPFLTLNDFL